MQIQQIRNTTVKIKCNGVTFLVDPWLEDKGKGFSAPTVIESMRSGKSPLNNLPFSIKEILNEVDYLLINHIHPDHFTLHYLDKNIKIILQKN